MAVQSLPPGMVGLVVRSPRRQVCIGVPVDADEETLDAAEKGVVVSSADGGETLGVSAAVEGGGERVRAVGNQVEDRLAEREAANSVKRDDRVAGADCKHLIVDLGAEIG